MSGEYSGFKIKTKTGTYYTIKVDSDKEGFYELWNEDKKYGTKEGFNYTDEVIKQNVVKGFWGLFRAQDEKITQDVGASEYTGGSSNYYKVFVQNPTTLSDPYEAECNDIIEALQMTFAEGNAFKAIWRKAKARQGVQKKGYDNGLYDSEKVVFFGERMVVEAKTGEVK